jgi:hypothetical protein
MRAVKSLVIALSALVFVLAVIIMALGYSLKRTALDRQFMLDQIEQRNLGAIAGFLFSDVYSEDRALIEAAIENTVNEQRLHVVTLIQNAIFDTYAFLHGESKRLALSLDFLSFEESLQRNVRKQLALHPPEGFAKLSPEEKEAALIEIADILHQRLMSKNITFDSAVEPPGGQAQVLAFRDAFGVFKLVFKITLFAAIVAGVLLAFLDSPRVPGLILLGLGSVFFVVGSFCATALGQHLPPLIDAQLLPGLQDYWPILGARLISPLGGYGLWCVCLGTGFLIVSFFVHPRREKKEPANPFVDLA